MITFITMAMLGAILIALGICNMMGNISSLHWYHRQRVSEADKKPMGRLVGIGTLLIGAVMPLFGACLWIHEATGLVGVVIGGTCVLIVGIVAGLSITLYGIHKYNKGIF